MTTLFVVALLATAEWKHPAGIITDDTLAEVRAKVEAQPWARDAFAARRAAALPWADAPLDTLRAVFPKRRGNVYHNFSCPDDRTRLVFDPFNPREFRCSTCNRAFPPDADAGIYEPDDPYHGTVYDGWACIFYQQASAMAVDLAVMGRIENNGAFTQRARDILRLYADLLPTLTKDREGQYARIFTYHREGDNKILDDLATAYELLRDGMPDDERRRVERDVLERLLNDLMLEPFYTYDHNNIYQWHRTILQTAAALERDDLVDWCFGYGDSSPEKLPEHRSLRRIVATHFKPDGAFWEMCSGYHLYPVHAFCEIAVLSHNLSRMDPERFPPDRYDFGDPKTDGGRVLAAALHWFLSMAMPDRSMTTVGDSMLPRGGMDSYAMTAEVGYRYFDIRAIGDYAALREGKRTWNGLLYGAPQIVQHDTPFTSSYLSSGWVALRNEWKGNRVWVGLNALIPGGSHQHADRLGFTHYSHGQLLTLEKATPYNESTTRVLGTLTPAHNTVTVDKTSQKQGESLEGAEIPEVRHFFSGKTVKFAQLAADKLYGQTEQYRRVVALIEDVVVDCFRVRGGAVHDWTVNHAGAAPRVALPMAPAAFEPVDWLANGRDGAQCATTDAAWTAEWTVGDVTSRLTLLGSPDTEVYALQTYPVDNAVVTDGHPPCQTLCVRRHDDASFVALWDAWKDTPNLQSAQAGRGDTEALEFTTASSRYCVLIGPGEARFGDIRLQSDAVFTVYRHPDALTAIDGTRVAVETPQGELRATVDGPATFAAEREGDSVTVEVSGNIQYDTYGGEDHRRDVPGRSVAFEGNLWPAQERP